MNASAQSRRGALPALAASVVLLLILPSVARAAQSLTPQKYVDKLNGFSLRPPVDTERIKEPSSSTLVRWVRRDDKTDAISWTLGVNVALVRVGDPNALSRDANEYAAALVAQLKKDAAMEISSAQIIRVAGHDAIDLRAGGGLAGPVWRRQVYVLAQPGRFLVFWITGGEDAKEALAKLLQDVLATVEILDPLEAVKAQLGNLANGRQFLAELARRPLTPAEKPQWLAFLQDGKVVGWTLQTEALVRVENRSGLEVRTVTMLHLPKDQLRLQRRTLFASADGAERWKETLQVGEGDAKDLVQEEGMRKDALIVCTVAQGRGLKTRNREIPTDPNEPHEMYLPKALGLVLPRLLDLGKPASYAFATYSSEDNRFQLRTFTVIGPETITLGGKSVPAVHLTDVEEANDEAASDLWVDPKGTTLRIRAPGWPVIETSTREEIVAKMPEAAKYVEEALKK